MVLVRWPLGFAALLAGKDGGAVDGVQDADGLTSGGAAADKDQLDDAVVEFFHRTWVRCSTSALSSVPDSARSCGCPDAKPPHCIRLNEILPEFNQQGKAIMDHLNPGTQKRGTNELRRILTQAGIPITERQIGKAPALNLGFEGSLSPGVIWGYVKRDSAPAVATAVPAAAAAAAPAPAAMDGIGAESDESEDEEAIMAASAGAHSGPEARDMRALLREGHRQFSPDAPAPSGYQQLKMQYRT
eukprot:1990339-Prymnesium_polylepis.1